MHGFIWDTISMGRAGFAIYRSLIWCLNKACVSNSSTNTADIHWGSLWVQTFCSSGKVQL